MTGKLDKFYIEHGIHGASVMTTTNRLTPGCIADGEIDAYIELLKGDLDACAKEMKRVIKRDRRALFMRRGANA